MGASFGCEPKVVEETITVYEGSVAEQGVSGGPLWQWPDGSTIPIKKIAFSNEKNATCFYGPGGPVKVHFPRQG